MELRKLLNDDDAVSPVIGVILMVAITVILAAVIATFVLGLGEQVSQTAPQASFSFDLNEDAVGDSTTHTDTWGNEDADNGGGDHVSSAEAMLNITHSGGATIQAGRLGVVGSSVTPSNNDKYDALGDSNDYGSTSKLSAGNEISVWVQNGDTIRIVWTSEGGQDSATLSEFDVPE